MGQFESGSLSPRFFVPAPDRWHITLSPVPEEGDRLEITVSALDGYDLGWLNTYVLETGDDGWAVTGTAAPVGLT